MFTVTHQFISEGIAEVILLITSLYLRELLRSVHHSPVYNWGNCRGLSLTSLSLRESPVYIWGNCWGQSITHQSISEGTAEVYHSPVYLWGNHQFISEGTAEVNPSLTSLYLRELQRSITHQFISEGITSLYLRELLRSIHHSPVYIWGNCRGLSSQGAFQVKFTSRFPLSKKRYCRCLGGPWSSATRFSHWILHKEERSQPAKRTSN